ncbi:class I adenylate-forming enzyme family protein [Candidatus Albibeggiatoa sp. nov. BB20]|uniref:class I adenylate-forming enzyme family protein n=1 Tax=Candidatus Albibeggiatoa sp. nov. BB20 TaxID=3162723 RepID=UPI0033659A46
MFATHIDHAINNADWQHNTLSDGTMTCAYQEISALFDVIADFLAEHQVQADDCLAIEGVNSVPAALILLYLLKQGYSFVLYPPMQKQGKELAVRPPIPDFCRYRLIINPTPDNASTFNAELLEHISSFEINDHFNSALANQGFADQKLYLRTSGSMGTAKIVVHNHQNFVGNVQNCIERHKFTTQDNVFIPVPIFHLYGLGAIFLPAILTGANVYLQAQSNILKFMQAERSFNPTVIFVTPTLCEMMTKGLRSERNYRLVVTSGDRIKPELFREFDAKFSGLVNQYGSTEMGATAASSPTDGLEDRVITMGKPMAGVEIKIDEENTPQDDSGERIGELYCKHPYGFERYINEQGEEIAPAPEWYRSGDLVKIHENSDIEVIGRSDNRVNRNGYLVLLSDVEAALEKITDVEQAIVLPITGDDMRGQRIAAFCISDVEGKQIRETCFDILPQYAIPDEVHVLKTLPMLPSGKVDRQKLKTGQF